MEKSAAEATTKELNTLNRQFTALRNELAALKAEKERLEEEKADDIAEAWQALDELRSDVSWPPPYASKMTI